jgi:hypothetical protein
MDPNLGYGVGIAVLFAFLRWALPALPKPIAWSGVIAGAIIVLVAWTMPQMNITLPAIVLFLVGAACLGGAVHLALKPKNSALSATSGSAGSVMGNVHDNTGIITQGQQGDNSIGRK